MAETHGKPDVLVAELLELHYKWTKMQSSYEVILDICTRMDKDSLSRSESIAGAKTVWKQTFIEEFDKKNKKPEDKVKRAALLRAIQLNESRQASPSQRRVPKSTGSNDKGKIGGNRGVTNGGSVSG